MTHTPPTRLRQTLLIGSTLLFIAVVLPISVYAGLLQRAGGEQIISAAEFAKENSAGSVSSSILDIPVLAAASNVDPDLARGGDDIQVYDSAVVSTGPVSPDQMAAAHKRQSGEISVYVVREGDSLSQIAEMFGVTSNTILWANDLPRATAIHPGDTLVILPIAGVRHVVKAGDTIASIAKKYDGDSDEILSFNQLTSADDITVGMTVIVPGGEVAAPPVRTTTASSRSSGGTASGSFLSHPLPGSVKTQGIHGYNAVDLASSIGTPIRAAASGEVIVAKSSGWNGGYGSYVVIRHSNGVQTLYAHMSRNDVGVGQKVSVGEVIGAVGTTGKSTGPHLHFEVRGAVNPF